MQTEIHFEFSLNNFKITMYKRRVCLNSFIITCSDEWGNTEWDLACCAAMNKKQLMSTTRISLGQPATLNRSDFGSALSETNICYRTFWQKTESSTNLWGRLSFFLSVVDFTDSPQGNPSAESWWRLMFWSKTAVLLLTSWGMKAWQDLSLQSPRLLFEHHSLKSSDQHSHYLFSILMKLSRILKSSFSFPHLHLFLAAAELQVVTVWCENCQLGWLEYQRF